jgi:hypothetical protein
MSNNVRKNLPIFMEPQRQVRDQGSRFRIVPYVPLILIGGDEKLKLSSL